MSRIYVYNSCLNDSCLTISAMIWLIHMCDVTHTSNGCEIATHEWFMSNPTISRRPSQFLVRAATAAHRSLYICTHVCAVCTRMSMCTYAYLCVYVYVQSNESRRTPTDMTHSYMCNMTHPQHRQVVSCSPAPNARVYLCYMTHSHVWRVPFICVTRLTFSTGGSGMFARSEYTRSYVWHDLFICVTCLIHMCDTTHLQHRQVVRVCPRRMYTFTSVAWPIHMCDMTCSYVWHDSPAAQTGSGMFACSERHACV